MDRERVETTYRKLLDAWNERNAEAFARLFTDEGNAIGFDGSQMNGRAEIVRTLATIFQSHSTASYVSKIREIREITPDVVLLRAVVGMMPPGEIYLNPAVNAVQSVVFVRQGDDLKIALLQSTPAAFHGRPEVAEALTQELEAIIRDPRPRN